MEMQDKELSLWGITEKMVELEEMLIVNEGEITEESEMVQKNMEILLSLKVDSCVGFVQYEENNIEVAKQKMKELKSYITFKENKLERFDSLVKSCMAKMNKDIFKGEYKQIKLKKASQVISIEDENSIPMIYTQVETTTKIKKAEIKKAIKNGYRLEALSEKIEIQEKEVIELLKGIALTEKEISDEIVQEIIDTHRVVLKVNTGRLESLKKSIAEMKESYDLGEVPGAKIIDGKQNLIMGLK